MAINSPLVDSDNLKRTNQNSNKIKAANTKPDYSQNLALRRDNSQYVHHMLGQLRKLVKNSGEPSLVYFLEMAGAEASDLLDRLNHEMDKNE